MKNIYIKRDFVSWQTVFILSVIVATLNVFRVILGFANTPNGFTYLAVGHYYLDYFEYLQQIAQGMMSHTTVFNQFATDDPTKTIIGWGQYLIIGRITRFFHLSAVTGYWLSIFFLSLVLLILIFYIIKKLLPNLNLVEHLVAWFFCLFASPFISFKGIPYDFWYAPMSFFHRLGGVPHHIVTEIFTIICLFIGANIFDRLANQTVSKLIIKMATFIIFLVMLLTFAPLQVANILSAIFLLGLVYIFRNTSIKKIVYFLSFIVLIIFPVALFIKHVHDGSSLFQRAIAWESSQEYHPELWLIFLTTGPIVIFAITGLKKYFQKVSNLKLLLLFYVTFSYLYFFSPLAKIFGTFNGRFLSPSVYILFGVLAVLGLLEIAAYFGKLKNTILIIMTIFLVGYFIWVTSTIFILFGQVDQTSYLPNPIFNGLKFFCNEPTKTGVLTSPDKYFGLIVPVFADKNVYLGRMIFTPDFDKKSLIADRFYSGLMSQIEAEKFLKENKIGFVLLTFMEKYRLEDLEKYSFLKSVFNKEGVSIYKVL